jgi:NADH-quinone oxidoreductase subunit F
MQKINLNNFEQFSSSLKKNILPDVPMVMVGMGTCGIGNGADALYETLQKHAAQRKYDCIIKPTGCFGFCAEEPLVTLYQPGKPLLVYARVDTKDAIKILDGGMSGNIYKRKVLCRIENWDFITSKFQYGTGYEKYPLWNEIPFFKGQKKIVLRNAGLINPESIEDYLAVGGYRALFKVLSGMTPDDIIAEVKNSGMRGRGGAGFPTGVKWELMKKNHSEKKYLICNADEGDPGAYMNRNEIESDPHSILEGMMIAAYAMGSDEGIAYIRAEYPLAVKRLEKAQKLAVPFRALLTPLLKAYTVILPISIMWKPGAIFRLSSTGEHSGSAKQEQKRAQAPKYSH